ncbi:MAG: LTA synthase family protein [Lachnospiraceae bacterium]|nr:LTA synthase family protein [Lachnospiraceae bacterium]
MKEYRIWVPLFFTGIFAVTLLFKNEEDWSKTDLSPFRVSLIFTLLVMSVWLLSDRIYHWLAEKKVGKQIRSSIAWILFILSPIVCYVLLEITIHGKWLERTDLETFANLIWYYLLYIMVACLTHRLWAAVLVGQTFGVLISMISYTLVEMRDIPLLPMLLAQLGTLQNVADKYRFRIPISIYISLMGSILWVVFCAAWMRKKTAVTVKKYIIGLTAGLLCGILGFVGFRNYDFKSAFYIGINYWDVKGYYQRHGFVLSFLTFAQNQRVEKPSDYSTERVQEILKPYTKVQSRGTAGTNMKKQPNIIAIMNESFADYDGFNGLTFNKPLAPFYQSLQGDNVIKGNMYVSIFGGGTVNTEYEFLTGNSLAYLPTQAIPFQQFLSEPAPSLATEFKARGYETIAMHPYYESGYSRKTSWTNLGFDSLYFMDTYEPFDYSDRLRGLISDEANYQEMLPILRQQDKPVFFFDVTMQNHGDYEADELTAVDTGLRINGLKEDEDRANVYFNLVQHSDRALENLITELKSEDEPTVLVMFGDHQPSLGEAFLNEMMGKDRKKTDEYQVPFLIWANFPLNKAGIPEKPVIGSNFLGTYLLRAVYGEEEMNAFHRFQDDVMLRFPAMTIHGSLNQEGEWVKELTDPVLQNYRTIVYDRVKGDWQKSRSYYE